MHASDRLTRSELTSDEFLKLVASGRPVHLCACTVTGPVELSYRHFSGRLVCEDCTFDSPVLALEARFGRSVSFTGSKFNGGLNWTGAHIGGGLILSGSRIAIREELTDAERWPDDIIEPARSSQAAGLGRMRINGPLEMDGVIVDGTLDLENTVVKGPLRLRGARIAGRLNGRCSQIAGECDLDALRIPAPMTGLTPEFQPTQIGGDCIFSSANLGGHVTLAGVYIDGHLRFTSSHIGGWLMMCGTPVSDASGTQKIPRFPRAGRPFTHGVAYWRGAMNLSFATVEGTVVLDGAELHGPLRLDNATVKQDVNLHATWLEEGWLSGPLRPCRILGPGLFSINATALKVGGSLAAYSIQCEGGICFDGAQIAQQVTISGRLPKGAATGENYYPASVGTDAEGYSVLGQSFQANGGVFLNGLNGSGILALLNARIKGKFSVAPLYSYSKAVQEDVSCTRLRGGLVLEDCEIGSSANLQLARISAPAAVPEGFLCPGVRLCRTRISGGLDASGMLLRGTLEADGAAIADALNLSGAVVTGDVKVADAALGTSLVLGGEPDEGDPHLAELGSWIGGRLIARKLKVNNGCYLLCCTIGDRKAAERQVELGEQGIWVRRANADRGFTVQVPAGSAKPVVDLVGAEIGGDLTVSNELSYSPRPGPPGEAFVVAGHLDARAIRVEGQWRLSGIQILGDVNLPDAQIGGGFELIRTQVMGDLDMRGAQVKGEIFRNVHSNRAAADPEEVSPVVKGRVLLSGAQVRVLRLHFVLPAGQTNASVTLPTEVDLDHAQVGKLIVSGQLRANTPPKFRFSGLKFDEIVVEKLEANASHNQFVHLLEQMEPQEFNQGVYLQVEKWLRDRGKDKEADAVYLALRRRDLKSEREDVWKFRGARNPGRWLSALLVWLGRSVLYRTVADGVRVMRLFWLWVLALIFSTWLFSRRESVQHPSAFAPKSEYEEVITARGQTPPSWAAKTRVFWTEEMGEPEAWSWKDGMWVALRVHVPLVELFARSDWVPSERRITGVKLRYETYASYMRLFSVVALPLMLTAATGLLKRK